MRRPGAGPAPDREAVTWSEELSAAVSANLMARRDLADAYKGMGRFLQGRDRAAGARVV
ncbi:MAG TPA: hypothetical protein VKB88_00670 [Bryobacteraceae bacterium]|nr:hypothetical protein [Bryobacteraceae bacterium]